MGTNRRARAGVCRSLTSCGLTNVVAGGRTGPAGLVGAITDGHSAPTATAAGPCSRAVVVSGVAAFVVPTTTSYHSLLASAFFIGLFPDRRSRSARRSCRAGALRQSQGTALGISVSVSSGSRRPFRRRRGRGGIRWQAVFRGVGVLLLAWACLLRRWPRNNPVAARPSNVRRCPRATPGAGRLVARAFYFLTSAASSPLYLPAHPAAGAIRAGPRDAGFRAAGRGDGHVDAPLGGWLSDRNWRRAVCRGVRRRGRILAADDLAVR